MSGARAYTWGGPGDGAGGGGDRARDATRSAGDEDVEDEDVQPEAWEEVRQKAAMELTVMAKACSSKGRAEVAEATSKVIDSLHGKVEIRSTAQETVNGTKHGICSVTVVHDATALAAMEEPLIVLSTELAYAPGMYITLAQGCLFPHELVHQLAAASEWYAEQCAISGAPGLPPLRFAYKQDTVRLQRQGVEKGASIISFSLDKVGFQELINALPSELKSLMRLVLDTDGQLVSIEVRMPEVKPWVPLRVMELRAEVKLCIYSPELADNEELFAARAAQLLYAEAGLQGSFVAHRALKWGGHGRRGTTRAHDGSSRWDCARWRAMGCLRRGPSRTMALHSQ
jgi:hypothetical protein